MCSRQLTHIKTNLLAKGLNFSVIFKTLPNKDIIATIEDVLKDLEKEEAGTIHAKISLTLQNSKPSKDNLSEDEHKVLKELQSDTSIVILPADKGRSIVILKDYLEKCMDHINNGPYQLLKKDPTTKINAKRLKQVKVLKENEFIDNKLYYFLKPTRLHRDFMLNPKYASQEFLYVLLFHIVATCIKILINTLLAFLKLMLKMKITTLIIQPHFPTTSEMFSLKMMR